MKVKKPVRKISFMFQPDERKALLVQLLVFEVNDPTIEERHQRVFWTAVKMHKKLSFAFDMQLDRKKRKKPRTCLTRILDLPLNFPATLSKVEISNVTVRRRSHMKIFPA